MKGIVQRSPNTEVNRAIIGTEQSLDRIEELMEKLSASTEILSTSSKLRKNTLG